LWNRRSNRVSLMYELILPYKTLFPQLNKIRFIMKLLEGIQLHELVLIILGFILGLVLIFVFLNGALRGKTNLKLLFGFVAPLIMIGYPSIQSVEFSKDIVKIDKLVEQVNQNPTDTVATNALRAEISTLPKSRCVNSSDAMATIANAQAAVGLYDSAKETIQKAVDLNPKSAKATEIRSEIEDKWRTQKSFEGKAERLKQNLELLKANPQSRVLRDSVAVNLEEIKNITPHIHVSQRDMLSVSMAAAIGGESKAAEKVVDDVLRVSPNQPEAKKLKEAIRDKQIEKKFPPRESAKPKPQTQKPVTPSPNSRMNSQPTPAPPVVEAPAALKVDTAWSSRLIPKAASANFVKWDKEQ
jgi:tetratricopeptide (TPR) repeat protein